MLKNALAATIRLWKKLSLSGIRYGVLRVPNAMYEGEKHEVFPSFFEKKVQG